MKSKLSSSSFSTPISDDMTSNGTPKKKKVRVKQEVDSPQKLSFEMVENNIAKEIKKSKLSLSSFSTPVSNGSPKKKKKRDRDRLKEEEEEDNGQVTVADFEEFDLSVGKLSKSRLSTPMPAEDSGPRKKKRKKDRVEEEVTNGWGWQEEVTFVGKKIDDEGSRKRRKVDLADIPPHILSNLVKAKPSGAAGALTSEDIIPNQTEGWIIQCPQNVDLRSLLRKKRLNLKDGSTRLFTEDEDEDSRVGEADVYEAITSRKNEKKDEDDTVTIEENAVLILSDGNRHFKISSVPLKGHITIRKHIEDPPPADITVPTKKSRKLPSGIKERHPIYGVDFSEALSKMIKKKKKKL